MNETNIPVWYCLSNEKYIKVQFIIKKGQNRDNTYPPILPPNDKGTFLTRTPLCDSVFIFMSLCLCVFLSRCLYDFSSFLFVPLSLFYGQFVLVLFNSFTGYSIYSRFRFFCKSQKYGILVIFQGIMDLNLFLNLRYLLSIS